ncbi:MurR/RpiR family transcriptional regulator [Lactovum odontotermitis]
MFDTNSVKKLNDLEMLAFDYINCEPEKVQNMTIREFADTIHTSTTVIVRLASKLGFKGWADLKYYLKSKEAEFSKVDESYKSRVSLDLFWKQLAEPASQKKVNQAATAIANSKYTVFLGLGTSDALCQYGARYFSNLGISAFAFSDMFRPVGVNEFADTVAIVLSVSGETLEVVQETMAVKRSGAFLITISNNEKSPLSKMADIDLSYNVLNEYATPKGDVKLTTQIPALALLELLAYRTHQISNNSIIL